MRHIRTLLLSLILMLPLGAQAGDPPKRQFRGAWFPTVTNGVWRNMSPQQVRDDISATLDSLASVNCNVVLFQVRPQSDALFASPYEPWSRFLTGTQGRAPDPPWDPMRFVIDECHRRGMEMHAWINPYRVSTASREPLAPNHLYFQKPHLFVTYGKQVYFNPGEPESRAHILRVVADIVRRYDVDGIHFDDYFYPYRVEQEEFPDEDTFQKYHRLDGYEDWDKLGWRRSNVNRLVRALNDTIKRIKPWVKFGISPFGVWRNATDDVLGSDTYANQTNYDDLFADIRLWCRMGWIDYNVPQLYWSIGHARVDYKVLIQWWSENKFEPNLYIGQSLESLLSAELPDGSRENQLYRKMQLVREDPSIGGNVWWPGTALPHDAMLMDSLRNRYQRHLALMPRYPWLDTIPPPPVAKLSFQDGRLRWEPTPTEDPLNQASFYVVYRFDPGEIPNFENATRILAIVHDTQFEIPRTEQRYRYAITVLDRLQNESPPSALIEVEF